MKPIYLFFTAVLAAGLGGRVQAATDGPSFDCPKVVPESVEGFICRTPQLAQDDREMANLYHGLISLLPIGEKEKGRIIQRKWLEERSTYDPNGAKAWQLKSVSIDNELEFNKLLANKLHALYQTRIAALKTELHILNPRLEVIPWGMYSNPIYGFEFRYPAGMRVISSSDGLPFADDDQLGDKSVVAQFVGGSEVRADLAVTKKLTKDKCEFPDDSDRDDKSVNGFLKDDETDDYLRGGGSISHQWYRTFHDGNCVGITFTNRRLSKIDDGTNSGTSVWDQEMDIYSGGLRDIINSFQFLDREPNTK